MNEFIRQQRTHRSIRHFTGDEVPRERILEAVEAGQAASTSGAIQAYSVIHVVDEAKRQRLVKLTGGQPSVAEAGAFFIICGDERRLRLAIQSQGGAMTGRLENFLLTVIDATLFAQNFALALESMGYGVCYIGGLRNHPGEVDRLFHLPEHIYPLYGLCVGVPAHAPIERPRLDPRAILSEDGAMNDDETLRHIAEYDARYERYLSERGADPSPWSAVMRDRFRTPLRTELGAYYRVKGADLT